MRMLLIGLVVFAAAAVFAMPAWAVGGPTPQEPKQVIIEVEPVDVDVNQPIPNNRGTVTAKETYHTPIECPPFS